MRNLKTVIVSFKDFFKINNYFRTENGVFCIRGNFAYFYKNAEFDFVKNQVTMQLENMVEVGKMVNKECSSVAVYTIGRVGKES